MNVFSVLSPPGPLGGANFAKTTKCVKHRVFHNPGQEPSRSTDRGRLPHLQRLTPLPRFRSHFGSSFQPGDSLPSPFRCLAVFTCQDAARRIADAHVVGGVRFWKGCASPSPRRSWRTWHASRCSGWRSSTCVRTRPARSTIYRGWWCGCSSWRGTSSPFVGSWLLCGRR